MAARKKPAAKQSQKQADKAATKRNSQTNDPASTLYVQDRMATEGPRTHTLLDSKGKTHIFTFPDHGAQLAIPSDVVTSSRLIQNDGFIVRKEKDGVELKARAQNEEQAVLQADECVARFDELTQKALLQRCLNRGANFHIHTTKDTMITYLMGATVDDLDDDEDGFDDDDAVYHDEEGNEILLGQGDLDEVPEDTIARLMASNEKAGQLSEDDVAKALRVQG